MPELPTTLAVDRTSLTLPALELNASPYKVTAFGPGERDWDFQSTSSNWVHGEALTSARLARAGRVVGVRVNAASVAALDAAVAALVAAVSQFQYTITGTVDGEAFTWSRCWPARMTPVPRGPNVGAGELDKYMLVQHAHEYMLAITSAPTVAAGLLG